MGCYKITITSSILVGEIILKVLLKLEIILWLYQERNTSRVLGILTKERKKKNEKYPQGWMMTY
jgi:hypothetical protein